MIWNCESRGTVPEKALKGAGGIAPSQTKKFQHRHNYDLQKTFDRLYKPGQAGNGSRTPGTDGRTIFVALIQKQFGTIVDRVVQQCVKQVLEPICEAKFYYHSYGFRPDRSAENAIQVNAAAVEFGNPRQETTEHNPSDAESAVVSEWISLQ